jgi:radical SAM superfamily enzyme YgiQ (UPF0313 family)
MDLPLSMLAASSMVAQDYQVKIIDQRLDPHWAQNLKHELRANPLCVGVTAMTSPQIHFGLEAARIVKEVGDSTKLIWGGVHATLLPEQTVQHPLVDIVVVGEGELSFRNLVRALEKKRSLADVRGIVFKRGGRVIKTEPEDFVDPESLPELPYHLVDVEKYIGSQGRFLGETTRSLIFISSRGCPWQCTYCCNPRLSRRLWRSMSAEKTFDQVANLVDRFNLDAVAFHDEEFLINRARAEKIAALIGGKFRWWIQGRMDRLKAVDLTKMEKGGLCAVQPGIESGSERILKLIKKGETVADMIEANRRLAQTSIEPLYNFMMGFPTETYDELMQSVDLAIQLLDDNPRAQISGFYVLVPYPGTEIFDFAVEHGFNPPDSLEKWAVFHRQHLATPWIQDRLDLFETIMFTSKLIDGIRLERRLKQALGGIPIPLFPLRHIANFYRRRWRKHNFDRSLDIKLMRWTRKRFFHW